MKSLKHTITIINNNTGGIKKKVKKQPIHNENQKVKQRAYLRT